MNEIIFYKVDRENLCETKYFDAIAVELQKHIDEYSIVFTADYQTLPPTMFKKIVILGGDENGNAGIRPYSQYSDVVAVFRFYNTEGRYDNKYVFPIPPGYNCRSNGKIMSRMYPEQKILSRGFDIFYSGQVLAGRIALINQLERLKDSFKIFSQTNSSFRQGLDIDDYYRCLGNTKICVAPDGTAVDTFRFVEACGSGCIVITTLKPDLWYYKDASVIFIQDWSQLTVKSVSGVLGENWDLHQKDIFEYYNRCLSERAVAEYIIKNIKN